MYWLKKANGRTVKLKSKLTIKMEQGYTLIVKTPGGGGYNDPLDREPELVLQDVLDGKVSLQSALNKYGVIIEHRMMKLNIQATLKLRKELKLGSSP